MAVVQISRIQVRRGRKGTTNIPQLASGELGWAVDTQELFIGNGSVAEGAPYVGNTKVLTEHDNILDLALQYQYKRNDASITTGPSVSQPIQRTLQEILDDSVSVRSFGVIGDGVADDYVALQRAIDQLYLNDSTKGLTKSRVILKIEAGEYVISQALRLPPFVHLVGAGKDKTIIRCTSETEPVVITVNGDSTPGSYDTVTTDNINQARFIEVSGITFEHTDNLLPVMIARNMRNSMFNDVKFKGAWGLSTQLNAGNSGITFEADSALVTCQDNVFDGCDISNVSYALDSTFDIKSNTFENMLYTNCGAGTYFGYAVDGSPGKQSGPSLNKFVNSKFIDIDRWGIYVEKGTGNISSKNTFISVGNEGPSSVTAVYPVVYFGETGNSSSDDYFERSIDLSNNKDNFQYAYVGEFGGSVNGEHKLNKETVVVGTSDTPLVRLSISNLTTASYKIEYLYTATSSNLTRQGTLSVIADSVNENVHITDEYDVIGNDTNNEDLVFGVSLDDINSDTIKDTITVKYSTTETGNLKYWYSLIS